MSEQIKLPDQLDEFLADREAKRRNYLPPGGIKVLFIAESPPDPNSGGMRFFYSETLSRHDNLFRGLMLALYDADRDVLVSRSKASWLQQFQADGYYVDDLCKVPVNQLKPSDRSRARRCAVPGLLSRLNAMNPSGIIVCHSGVFGDIAEYLVGERSLLHEGPIPFPLGNHRAKFANAVSVALGRSR